MKKVSIANIIISIIIVIIAGVLFYNNRYNISNDMDNTEMYVMLRNMEVNANTQWQEFPDNKKLQNDIYKEFKDSYFNASNQGDELPIMYIQ